MKTAPVEYYRISFTHGISQFIYAAGIRAAKKSARAKTGGGLIHSVSVLRFNDWVSLYRKGVKS